MRQLIQLLTFLTSLHYLIAQPTFNSGEDPKPNNEEWVAVDSLSDEFNDTSTTTIDGTKWHSDPLIAIHGLRWIGREPGLFEEDNVSVQNGELYLEAEIFDNPKTQDGIQWSHGGAIIRSIDLMKVGMYSEAKMKTTETIMSGTFWMVTPNSDCNDIPKKELDVTESIGIRSFETKQPTLSWYENAAVNFLDGINANARQRSTSCLPAINRPANSGTFDADGDFHIYGFYWKTATDLQFFIDGDFAFSINPSIPFEHDMLITCALEIYDFNFPSTAEADGFNKTLEQRSTRYDWIRTWKLQDPSINTVDGNYEEDFEETIPTITNQNQGNVTGASDRYYSQVVDYPTGTTGGDNSSKTLQITENTGAQTWYATIITETIDPTKGDYISLLFMPGEIGVGTFQLGLKSGSNPTEQFTADYSASSASEWVKLEFDISSYTGSSINRIEFNTDLGKTADSFPTVRYIDAIQQTTISTLSVPSLPKERNQNVVVSPNPARTILNINIVDASIYKLLNLSGQTILEQKATGSIDVSNIEAGVYLLITEKGATKVIIE